MMRGRRVSPAVAVVSVDRPRTLRYRKAAVEEPRGPGARHVLSTFVLALLLAGGLAGLGWAFQSDTFRVRQVTISGASPAVQQAIEDLVAPGCAESLAGPIECPAGNLGPNELTLNAGGIARQVEQLPLVKSVQVKAVLPNRLQISVVERQPEAAWLVGTETFRVASDGVVIDRGPRDGLKVVVGQVAGEAVKPGDHIDVEIIKAAELLQERLPADFGIPPKRIEYSPVDGLAVIGDQDFIAMFGPPRDLNLKMAELQRIVQLAKDKKAPLGFVDLRYKTPYFRTR